MAKAATAWSLGNDGSCDGGARRRVCEGWATKGRSRTQTWVIAWLNSKPSPAEARPERHAIFQRYHGPGRSKNQSENVAITKSGTAQKVTKSSISSPMKGWPRSEPFRKWKIVQSICSTYRVVAFPFA